MTSALVVPSVRAHQLREFLDAWTPRRFWDLLIVVEDNPERTFDLPPEVIHLCWKDIVDELGASSWIISRRDSAIRSFGFLRAYRLGVDLVYTLDDDTRPVPGVDHAGLHRAALDDSPRWIESIPGMRTRGLPYANRGRLGSVKCNMGTWCGVPDLDAVGSLALGVPTDFRPPRGSRVLPREQYAPICGMNLAFRREFAPLAYFGLMGRSWPYARFDDIWFGLWAKRVCDHLGWLIAVGDPPIRHARASDPFVNLGKEAPGIMANEWMWERIDSARLRGLSAAGCMAQLGESLVPGGGYLSKLGQAIVTWAGLFDA